MKFENIYLIFIAFVFTLTGCDIFKDEVVEPYHYRASLEPFNSCSDLTSYLYETAEKNNQLIHYYNSEVANIAIDASIPVFSNLDGPLESVSLDSASNTSSIGGYSATNNQVVNVDEADFVKTDGQYTYLVSAGYFVIFDNWPADQSKELVRVELDGSPISLFVYKDLAWIVSNHYDYEYIEGDESLTSFAPRINNLTSVAIYDISDRNAPSLIRKTTMEGYFIDARRIDNQVHLVNTAHLDIYPLIQQDVISSINDLIPAITDKLFLEDQTTTSTSLISECEDIYRPGTANGTSTISLISFDLDQPLAETKRQTIISNAGTIYANQNNLYIATVEDAYWAWLPVVEGNEDPIPGTTFHKFSLTDQPTYVASGRVNGYIINQFAMDEYEGLFRTVTTEFAWWSNEIPKNTLFVLEQSGNELLIRSQLTGLGKPGETLYAARFLGDKGFLVTFEQIDPLYTLDLSDSYNPVVVGELEVPGFSTYLHPIDDELLLAIGRNGGSNSVNLSVFDISDFSNPSLLHSKAIGESSYSSAEYNHKAFTWYPREKLLAIPISSWTYDITEFGAYEVEIGLQLFSVDETEGINFYGSVNHNNFYQDDKEDYWYYPESIERSFFVTAEDEKSYLYSVSRRGMKVNSIENLTEDLAVLPLPVIEYDYGIFLE